MNKKTKLLPLSILILSLFLSACVGLIPLEEEPVTGDFGPKTSLQEQQIATFETLWSHLQENYIYLESADVNWDTLHDKYLQRLQAELTPQEFSALMEELAAELPEGSMGYQSRAERIEADIADTSS